MAITQRTSLDQLPVFQENPFNGRQIVPVFEFAVLISKPVPGTTPPYQFTTPVAVVGKSADTKTIYYARQSMWGEDGSVTAVHPNGAEGCIGEERFERLDKYMSIPLEDALPIMASALTT